MPELSPQKVYDMKNQGLTNNQIIQALQRDGYTSAQIFDILRRSPQPLNNADTPNPFMQNNESLPPPNNTMPPAPQGAPMSRGPMLPMQATPRPGGASNEELIEAIIDEKWNDLLEDVNRIVAWKDRTASRIDQLDQQLKDLKEQFDKLHEAIIGKVGEYDQHILQVGAEIKAMEKVFSKVLPVFTENVGELSRITDTMKKSQGKSK